MQILPMGLLVCAGILLLAWLHRSVLIVGLVASLAFGATALVTLTSLGGSSPLIYTAFSALLIAAVALRRGFLKDLGGVFATVRPIWVLCFLMVYSAVGALLLPRFFAGQTVVFVQSRTRSGVIEASLAPVGSNITQTGYFVLGGLTAMALCVLLLERGRMRQVGSAFLILGFLHAGMGSLDLLGKIAGAGDVLAPIRTASYAMLTEAVAGGFHRIAGAFSEASAFGSFSLACLAFSYTYWRRSRSQAAKWLAAVLLALTVLSTSSTAYVGLAILCIPVAWGISKSFFLGRATGEDLTIVSLMALSGVAVMAVTLYNAGFFEPFVRLLDAMVLNKARSASGQERAYWNIKSLQAFLDTAGLGVGFGSSRASSWPIAVVSQLGLLGSLMMGVLLAYILRGLGGLQGWLSPETETIVASVRNFALAAAVSASLAGGSADPGPAFFIALAVVASARLQARSRRQARAGAAPIDSRKWKKVRFSATA